MKQEIAAEVAEIVAKGGKRPHLAAILVGHDVGSETYVAAKVKACEVWDVYKRQLSELTNLLIWHTWQQIPPNDCSLLTFWEASPLQA